MHVCICVSVSQPMCERVCMCDYVYVRECVCAKEVCTRVRACIYVRKA